MTKQLTLPIQPPDANIFQNFYTSDANAVLVSFLKQFSAKKGEPFIYIWGNSGAGCTHLLHACCHAAQEKGFSAAYLPLGLIKKTSSPEVFHGLESVDVVCIDELESIVGDSFWQESLFHFYNRIQERMQYLLIAAKSVPQHLGFTLADLVSRLTSGVLFQVRELNDSERLTALQQRARLRGLEFSDEVGQFLLLRLPRHAKALFSALEQLDSASLSLQRKLTIPLVKAILNL
jgi:DnaA-homolog protein